MVEVSARFGYHGTSVDRVVEGTGLARSTFYKHFPDRVECFLAAMDLVAEQLLAKLEVAAKEVEQGIDPVVEAMVGFARNDPAAAKLLFVESLAAGPRSLQLREDLLARVESVFEEALAREPESTACLNLPPWVLSRGAFRLLAIRLSRPDPELAALGEDLVAWANSYRTAPGQPRWQEKIHLGSIGSSPADSTPALDADYPPPDDPQRLPAGELARSQRLRILDAVARCAHERGYEELTVADITAERTRLPRRDQRLRDRVLQRAGLARARLGRRSGATELPRRPSGRVLPRLRREPSGRRRGDRARL
jgi:AcrR family transcriptional regulator